MEKAIMFIIPIFLLVIIVGLAGSNIFYLETTGETTKEFQEAEFKKIEEQGLTRNTYTVEIYNNNTEPEYINGDIGSFVVFVNNDSATHRLVTKFGDVDTGDLELEDSFKKYFSNSGKYIFTDEYNPEIVVEINIGVEFHKK